MRPSKEIQSEIDKLNEELKASSQHELKVSSAVHVLENLGWTHNGRTWVKPKATVKLRDYQAPVSAGGLASWDGGAVGGHVYVRSVTGQWATVSHLQSVGIAGFNAHSSMFTVPVSQLTMRPKEYFLGRKL